MVAVGLFESLCFIEKRTEIIVADDRAGVDAGGRERDKGRARDQRFHDSHEVNLPTRELEGLLQRERCQRPQDRPRVCRQVLLFREAQRRDPCPPLTSQRRDHPDLAGTGRFDGVCGSDPPSPSSAKQPRSEGDRKHWRGDGCGQAHCRGCGRDDRAVCRLPARGVQDASFAGPLQLQGHHGLSRDDHADRGHRGNVQRPLPFPRRHHPVRRH